MPYTGTKSSPWILQVLFQSHQKHEKYQACKDLNLILTQQFSFFRDYTVVCISYHGLSYLDIRHPQISKRNRYLSVILS